jgi:hypothetical protein
MDRRWRCNDGHAACKDCSCLQPLDSVAYNNQCCHCFPFCFLLVPAQVWIHGVDRVLVPKTRSNNSQNAGNAGMNGSQNAGNAGMNGSLESGNAGMNGGASASAGGANAATSGTVSPNGADADVDTSGTSGNGGGRRLFMRAHNTLF